MQDPVFACARGVIRKRGVMRARDCLKLGLGARPLSKALFYISSMLTYIFWKYKGIIENKLSYLISTHCECQLIAHFDMTLRPILAFPFVSNLFRLSKFRFFGLNQIAQCCMRVFKDYASLDMMYKCIFVL